jgi:transcriptional regulator with XRE-family HTH domain
VVVSLAPLWYGSGVSNEFNKAVGQRLRAIRKQKGYSLHQIEALSETEFKASVVGAYERGERALSVPRMQRLAEFYEVPLEELLPRTGNSREDLANASVTIDLNALENGTGPNMELVDQFLTAIQRMRHDFSGNTLTIRASDLGVLQQIVSGEEGSIQDVLEALVAK